MFVLFAVLLIGGQVAAFLTPPDGNAPPGLLGDRDDDWVGDLLIALTVLLLALLVHEGRNGIRVTMTVIAALSGLAAMSLMTDHRPWEDDLAVAVAVVTGLVMLALLLFAVILLYLPASNAYVRHMRDLRTRPRGSDYAQPGIG